MSSFVAWILKVRSAAYCILTLPSLFRITITGTVLIVSTIFSGCSSNQAYCILAFLRKQPIGYTIVLEDIVKSTGFKREDIISTIHHLGMLKEWKGQYVIHYTRSQVEKILEPYDKKKFDSSFCQPAFLIDDTEDKDDNDT